MPSLFGRNRLRELAQEIDSSSIEQHLAVVRSWRDDYHKGTLKKDKETSREQAYNYDFFVSMLGYREKPARPHSLEPKMTTSKGQLPDAVLSYTDPVEKIENISAVVELKGAGIALDRPQQRQGNLSPVQQGFKYKTQYRKCPFVIISNFYELRLYNDNQLDFERWTLDDLVNPEEDHLAFKVFYLLLHVDNFTSSLGVSATEELLSSVRVEQQEIGVEFYNEYRAARLELLRDVYRNNPSTRPSFHLAIEKAQKLIDRVVFSCFAEDRGLLPDNIVAQVISQADSSPFDSSLWNTLKAFFASVDKGAAKLGIPQGYNGGLFASDSLLDSLEISDGPVRAITALSRYDFRETLSVQILGRIFEQSISDLEEIRSKVLSSAAETAEVLAGSPGKGKRRTEGIYYTPDHVVRYIVDGSLGEYLVAQEDALKKKHGLSMRLGQEGYDERERRAYLEYQSVLQEVKVVDPACGSGAFLVGVFDLLLAENIRVDSILGGTLLSQDEYARDILGRNIYGVDLNEESIQISRLSLWLKTAKKGKKLTALDSNIVCGNSLVSDPYIAGPKAFDWQAAFPSVFANGGFDVVVGNPPYVDSETMVKTSPSVRRYISEKYANAQGNWDLLVPFIELAFNLLAQNGRMAYITSNKWLALDYGSATRKFIFPHLTMMFDATMERVFDSANVSSVIFGASTQEQSTVRLGGLKSGSIVPVTNYTKGRYAETAILTRNLSLLFSAALPIAAKLNEGQTLESALSISVFGAATTAEAYELTELVKEAGSAPLSKNQIKLINTGTIDKFCSLWGFATFSYLKHKFVRPIVDRDDYRSKFPRRFAKLDVPKIVITGIRYFEAVFDSRNEYIPTKSTVVVTGDPVDLAWLTAVLNSSFIQQYIRVNYLSSSMGGGINFTPDLVRSLPVVIPNDSLKVELAQLTQAIQELNERLLRETYKFERLVSSEYKLSKWPSKLSKWWELETHEVLTNFKTNLSLRQKSELSDYIEESRPKILDISNDLRVARNTLERKVRSLYGLTRTEYEKFMSA